jgi:chromosome segregation protein
MKLKRLEIIGFKSFRDRTVIDFSSGISGIVGPNGCGKSNIVDAIRWVMGEQRVSLLRGKKMDDVIFNGSEEAQPVSLAEVTLVMESGGYPFPAPYADCSEVMITRRVFRDEEGEYFINKVRCRLLDVKEFFMDTGVGARTYSLVEQGSIASLMEAKPEERRQYIEEAAGITKYKSRKEAVRKMESTKQNLLRLNDIMLREVKSQLMPSPGRPSGRTIQAAQEGPPGGRMALASRPSRSAGEEVRPAAALRQRLAETDDARSQLSVSRPASRSSGPRSPRTTRRQQLQEKLYTAKNEISIQETGNRARRGRGSTTAVLKERGAIELESLRARAGRWSASWSSSRRSRPSRTAGSQPAGMSSPAAGRRRRSPEERAGAREGLEKEKTATSMRSPSSRACRTRGGLSKSLEDIQRRSEREVKELEEHEGR